MSIKQLSSFLIIILTLAVVTTGCSTSEKAIEPEEDDTELVPLEEDKSENEIQQILASTRSRLSDVYNTQDHDMPEPFLHKDTAKTVQGDPFDGYRIQIISTRNIELADSVTTQFRMWADTTITGYTPKVYQSFRQPFYKVHVGDFSQQSRANEFSRLVKKKYPEAWVVHDRIDPNLVPADTTQFKLVKKEKPDSLREER